MKIGFYFECSTKSGGVYQYALNLLEALRDTKGNEFVVFNISPDFPYADFKLPNWNIIDIMKVAKKEETVNVAAQNNIARDMSFRRQFNLFALWCIRVFKLYRLEIFLTSRNAKKRAEKFEGHGIDLMFYHGPSELSFLTNIRGVVPIHDLEHRNHPEFPELSTKGQWQKREYIYKHIKKSAYKILVDSEIGKQDVVNHYGVEPERISIVPFLPPSYLKKNLPPEYLESVRAKYSLPKNFLYYPAQFWPHKNHYNLVQAVALLKKEGLEIPLVLTGGKQEMWGEYDRVMKFVKAEGIEHLVKFLGFVDGDEISALYTMAEALAMPTFIGPTNIPVYEAWFMECPVLYSDVRGPREQAGDAALLFDPYRPEDLAAKIKQIWKNDTLRRELSEKGTKRLGRYTRADFHTAVKAIITGFKK